MLEIRKNINGWTYEMSTDDNFLTYEISRTSREYGAKFPIIKSNDIWYFQELNDKIEKLKRIPIFVDDLLELEFYIECLERLERKRGDKVANCENQAVDKTA